MNETATKLNEKENSKEHSEEERIQLEDKLSQPGIAARVVSWTGSYLKVKFLRDGKPFLTYKGKNGSVDSAKKLLKDTLKAEKKAES